MNWLSASRWCAVWVLVGCPGTNDVPPTPGASIVTTAGTVTGPTYRLDVQLGDPMIQDRAEGPTYTLETNTPLKP